MMYFKIYEVFQIDYPEKIRRKVSFFVDVSSEIFHTGWFFYWSALKMTVPEPQEILTLRTFLMGFTM